MQSLLVHLCSAETDTPCWGGEIRVPYSAFAFTYKYAVISRSQAATAAANAAAAGGGDGNNPGAATAGSSIAGPIPPVVAAAAAGEARQGAAPRAAAVMNGAAPGRASASSLMGNVNVTAPNGPVCYTPPINSPSRSAAAAGPDTSGQVPGAAAAAGLPQADGLGAVLGGYAAVGNAQYVAALPPPPPPQHQQHMQQQGSGISAIFRNATSTLLEVGEPRVCR